MLLPPPPILVVPRVKQEIPCLIFVSQLKYLRENDFSKDVLMAKILAEGLKNKRKADGYQRDGKGIAKEDYLKIIIFLCDGIIFLN